MSIRSPFLPAFFILGVGCLLSCSDTNFGAKSAEASKNKGSKDATRAGGVEVQPGEEATLGSAGKNGERNNDDDVIAKDDAGIVKPGIDGENGNTEKVIKASFNVSRQADTAAWTNCLKVQINGGAEIDLGCNHGAIVPTVTADALAKPKCNVVRLILYSNGKKNRTTENPDHIANDFRITKLGTNSFKVQCNDNRDNDFNDLNLSISSADANLSIENTNFTCEP